MLYMMSKDLDLSIILVRLNLKTTCRHLKNIYEKRKNLYKLCKETEKNLHISTLLQNIVSVPKHYDLLLLHYDGPLISNFHNPQYKVITSSME